jgi:hypothetical protein
MSNVVVTGVVSFVSEKPYKDRSTGEDITLYSFVLDGQKTWYRLNTTPPKFGVGQTVRFLADGQKVDIASIEIVAAETKSAPAPKPRAASAGTGGATKEVSRDGYWANKEERDLEKEARYQTVSEPRMALSVAVEAASRVVDSALKNDALGFGTVAKSKRHAMLVDYVREVALDLALFIQDAPTVLTDARAARDGESAPSETETDQEFGDNGE